MNTFGRGGLSEYSPISANLRLTRQNYEAAVQRHGQVCRWLRANKCTCLDDAGRPDPNCPICNGDGWSYQHQTVKTKVTVKAFPLANNAFEVRDVSTAPILSLVSSSQGTPASPSVVNGRTLLINNVPHGQPVLVTYQESRVIPAQTFSGTVFGGVYIQLSGAVMQYGDLPAPYDITKVYSVANITTGAVYSVQKFSVNWVVIDIPAVPIISTDVLQVVADIVMPQIFLLTRQTQNKANLEWLQTVGGDAMCTAAAEYDIGEGDVITTLSSAVNRKHVRTKQVGTVDLIPEWFVVAITDIRDGSGNTYIQGVDYILVGTNTLLWLTSNTPVAGSLYEITIDYAPTYRVLAQLPQTRNAEGQAMPRSVALKLFQADGSPLEAIV